METHNDSLCEKQRVRTSPVLSFYDRLAGLEKKLGLKYICESDKPLAHECCLVICEVMHYPRGDVLIEGESIPREQVCEIFEGLTYEHLQHVCDRYKRVSYEIKRKRQYLRTALYNAAFELEAACVNDVRVDITGMG